MNATQIAVIAALRSTAETYGPNSFNTAAFESAVIRVISALDVTPDQANSAYNEIRTASQR